MRCTALHYNAMHQTIPLQASSFTPNYSPGALRAAPILILLKLQKLHRKAQCLWLLCTRTNIINLNFQTCMNKEMQKTRRNTEIYKYRSTTMQIHPQDHIYLSNALQRLSNGHPGTAGQWSQVFRTFQSFSKLARGFLCSGDNLVLETKTLLRELIKDRKNEIKTESWRPISGVQV